MVVESSAQIVCETQGLSRYRQVAGFSLQVFEEILGRPSRPRRAGTPDRPVRLVRGVSRPSRGRLWAAAGVPARPTGQ
jgi:hypothetical protein